MSKPTKYPKWATDELTDALGQSTKVEPTETKKGIGWQFLEKPPYNFFNWLLNNIYTWIKWLDENVVTLTGDQTVAGVKTLTIPDAVDPQNPASKSQLDGVESSLTTAIGGVGAGNLGFVTGTLADLPVNTIRTDTISLPSTGSWLLVLSGDFFQANTGGGALGDITVKKETSIGENIIVFNNINTAEVTATLTANYYKPDTNSISLYFAQPANSFISNIHYYAIRIS